MAGVKAVIDSKQIQTDSDGTQGRIRSLPAEVTGPEMAKSLPKITQPGSGSVKLTIQVFSAFSFTQTESREVEQASRCLQDKLGNWTSQWQKLLTLGNTSHLHIARPPPGGHDWQCQ